MKQKALVQRQLLKQLKGQNAKFSTIKSTHRCFSSGGTRICNEFKIKLQCIRKLSFHVYNKSKVFPKKTSFFYYKKEFKSEILCSDEKTKKKNATKERKSKAFNTFLYLFENCFMSYSSHA